MQSAFFRDPDPEPADYFIAIGDNAVRRLYFDRLKSIGVTPARCIAPTAWIAPSAELGDGVFVGAGAVIGAEARIADNAIINNLSLVDHDGMIGEDSQLTIGVILGGEVKIGRRCYATNLAAIELLRDRGFDHRPGCLYLVSTDAAVLPREPWLGGTATGCSASVGGAREARACHGVPSDERLHRRGENPGNRSLAQPGRRIFAPPRRIIGPEHPVDHREEGREVAVAMLF